MKNTITECSVENCPVRGFGENIEIFREILEKPHTMKRLRSILEAEESWDEIIESKE